MNVVERVTAFKLQTRALEDMQRGDIPGATRKLQAAATRLLDMGETELAQTMQDQAQQLTQQGQIAPETAKAARYKTRKRLRNWIKTFNSNFGRFLIRPSIGRKFKPGFDKILSVSKLSAVYFVPRLRYKLWGKCEPGS
jgi:hypothetical protein